MMKLLPIIFLALILVSCSKEEKPRTDRQNSGQNSSQNTSSDEGDTNLTKEEIFSSTLVQDIAGDDNEDLEIYLEEVIYPMVSKSNKVTLDKISDSLYLLSYDENGMMKNFLIQGFYSPVKDEMVFEKIETQTNAAKQFVK